LRFHRLLAVGVLAAALLVPTSAAAGSTRRAMVHCINAARAKHGLPKLRTSRSLRHSSSAFARWMIRHDRFGHRSHVSVSRRWRFAGEALAMHTGWRAGVHGTVRQWLHSPGHRAIVLSKRFSYVGVGLSRGRLGGTAATIWVLQVGR
jgi:uncharacterized protein YkwD